MGDRKGKWTGKEKKAAKRGSGPNSAGAKGSYRYEDEYIVFDMHGVTMSDAATLMNAALRRGDAEQRPVKLVHGYRSGHALRDAVRRWLGLSSTYRNRVQLVPGNDGVTIVKKAS